MVESLGLNIKGSISYPDHYPFDKDEMDKIRENSSGALLLTTEKDFWRLDTLNKDVYYLKINLVVDQKEDFNNLIIKTVNY